jgi:hypothetical protein
MSLEDARLRDNERTTDRDAKGDGMIMNGKIDNTKKGQGKDKGKKRVA